MSETEAPINGGTIPEALIERAQWICWRAEDRDGKTTKVPVDPETGNFASTMDDRTWTVFERALEYATSGAADGIGFVFTATDPLVGVDLDDCRDPETGEPLEPAPSIIEQLDSFTEVSPSGTGYHVILEGDLPDGRNRHGSIEMYDQARFFTVTADHVDGTPASINERQEALEEVHEEFIASKVSGAADTVDADPPNTGTRDQSLELEDEDLLEKARSASNGEKFDRLWRGSTAGYDSKSEADMALCCLLAFWTGGDRTRMDHLFRQSGLIREKWDEVHYADGSTYGEKTIERAIGATDEFYDPSATGSGKTTETGVESPFEGHVQNDASRPEQTYLEEKNRLLEQRVDELEGTIAEQREQLEMLTAERDELRTLLDQREEELEKIRDQLVDERSVRSRMKRLFRSS
ncbi:phage NrS-1 polymerase family protein [Natrarchaeobaculum sulfurireducens]|uniref:DNA primase/polymerase bifunctional N-terminal domain-containing protein n=1 Tax=Natrarchaeobaculum sulfurireducens TaxID=2044521 RepID=A0A346P9F1_9EURY|nr:hypothetical protein [Natrarchaeobaculum sulfurireducens]AXR76146.1 hypothetical protein AArc1_4029 [Natrarchaeobaculum sulfurireducens]